jgi:Ring finger domain/IQ calmodulin-binding motif
VGPNPAHSQGKAGLGPRLRSRRVSKANVAQSPAKIIANGSQPQSFAQLCATVQSDLLESIAPVSRATRRRAARRNNVSFDSDSKHVQSKQKPQPTASDEEWAYAHKQTLARGDSNNPCAICQEEFALQPQVLLSCSHVFHDACLGSFETFSHSRRCPMCRCTNYAKKLINDGAHVYRNRCATRIQAAVRGFLQRRKFAVLLETVVPHDVELKQRFYMRKLTKTTDKFIEFMDENDCGIDALFAELDRSVAKTRKTLEAADMCFSTIDDNTWHDVCARAKARDSPDCPICMVSYSQSTKKKRVILTCSHVFHTRCLESYEKFAEHQSSSTPLTCPLCRDVYQKRQWPS